MALLEKVKPKNEKELHSIIEKEIDALEEGLEILKYEFGLGTGYPDFLCIDSGGRLVIIEVKLQEDDNMLFQALRYYNSVDKERYAIANMFSGKKRINPDEHPRILLVAEKFSDDLRRLSTLVIPEIELYEYTVMSTPDEKQGICFHPVSIPKIEEIPAKPLTAEELREYITKDSLKSIFDKLIKDIKSIGRGIQEYTTQGYIGFKYRGRQIGWLGPHRKSFDIGAVLIDENLHVLGYEYTRIESGTEDYMETFEKIRKSFENICGEAK